MINMRLGLKVQILAGLITFLSVIGVNQYQFLHATNKPLHTRQTNEQNQSQDSFVFYSVIDEWQKYKYSVNGKSILEPMKLPNTKVSFNANDLLFVLTNTRKYFQDYSQKDQNISRNGLLVGQGVKVEDELKTLDFMISTLREDVKKNRPPRLQDPNFINANFRVIKWKAYNPDKPEQKQLRITKYAVFTHPGSHTKTSTYNTPIYSLKDNLATDKFYTKYTLS